MARQRLPGSPHAKCDRDTMENRRMNAGPENQDVISTRKRTGLFAARPALYIVLILCAVLATYSYKLRTEGIFSCSAESYTSDWYLAFCSAKSYGNYEHGAFFFDLEPSVRQIAASAEVLFLGSSRMQIALSTTAMTEWSSSVGTTYYLMGFGNTENVVFTREILRRIKPRAQVYVINIEQFFVRSETPPAKTVMREPMARIRYEIKRVWQFFHKQICHGFAAICGNNAVIFRSRTTGAYLWRGGSMASATNVSYDRTVDRAAIENEVEIGKEFLSRLPVQRECIILTMVPNVGTKIDSAKAISTALGINLVIPELNGLRTFDGSHLDRPSAERWSNAFLRAAAPRIRKCTGESHKSRP